MCYTCRSPDCRNIQSWKLKKESETGEWIWIGFSVISYDRNKPDSFLLSDFLPICHLVKFRLSGSVTLLGFLMAHKQAISSHLLHLVKSLSGSQQVNSLCMFCSVEVAQDWRSK